MEIQIKRRMTQFKQVVDICNPIQRNAIRTLTGKKTVSEKDIAALSVLGFFVYDCDHEMRKLFEVRTC